MRGLAPSRVLCDLSILPPLTRPSTTPPGGAVKHQGPIRPTSILFILALSLAIPAKTAFASGSERLRRDVAPTFEAIRLNLDPRKPGYSGSARIDLRVSAPTDSFQFHSEGLTLRRVTLRGSKAIVASTHAAAGPAVVTVRTRSPLQPGAYTLDIDF